MGKCIESIMLWGPTGGGKTSQAQELALYTAVKFEKKVRLISCSGGGWTVIQPAVDAGMVEPTFIAERQYPIETLDRMTKGWWPEDANDPRSPLIPPEKQGKRWDDVGALFFDSATEMCSWMMRTMVAREAAGQVKISAESLAARFKDGDTNYGTPGRAHFGTIQNYIEQFINQSKQISGIYTVWTALELRTSDETTRIPVYSPDLIGKAKSSSSPAWFDDCLHLTLVDTKTGKERRMYQITHTIGDDPIPYLAKTRNPLGTTVPDYLTGQDFSLYNFLSQLEKLIARGGVFLQARFNNLKAEQQKKEKENSAN